MTTSRQTSITNDYRARLLAHEASAVRSLEAAYVQAMAAIQPRLDALYVQIDAKLQAGEAIPLSWLYEAGRLQAIEQLIIREISQFGNLTYLTTQQLQHQAAALGSEAAQALLQATVPNGYSWSFGVPSPRAIAQLVGRTQNGAPLSDLFSGFGEAAAYNVKGVLIRGITLGQGSRVIARDVATQLGISRNRALVIARDQVNDIYRSAQLENYRANSDVLQGWTWLCALLPTSCAACVAMHGTKHPLDEEMQEHVCGRCAPVPLTKDWSEILGPLGIDTSGIPDTRPTFQSGVAWFAQQSEATQRSVLGNAKYDAWNNGDFSLEDLVGYDEDEDWGTSIKEKSLKELVSQ